MDEPFSALDVQTRAIMSNELLQAVGPDPARRRLRHPRPRGGDRARRQGRRADRRPRHASRRTSTSTCRGPANVAGDPLRPDAFTRALPPDLGGAARRGRRRRTPGRPRRCRQVRVVIDTRTRSDRHCTAGTAATSRRERRAGRPGARDRRRRGRSPGCAPRRRRRLLGGWQLLRQRQGSSTRSSAASRPASGTRSVDLGHHGTAQGSLGRTDPGHPAGGAARLRHRRRPRRRLGIALGRSRFLADCSRRTSRSPTRSRASCSARSSSSPSASASELEGRARRRAGVLRGLLQRLPGRPRGRPQPGRQRPHPRRLAAGRSTRQVVLPSAFTWILASLHIGFGFALIGAVVGEFLGADKGLGLLIRSVAEQLRHQRRARRHGRHRRHRARRRRPSSPRSRSACCAGARPQAHGGAGRRVATVCTPHPPRRTLEGAPCSTASSMSSTNASAHAVHQSLPSRRRWPLAALRQQRVRQAPRRPRPAAPPVRRGRAPRR